MALLKSPTIVASSMISLLLVQTGLTRLLLLLLLLLCRAWSAQVQVFSSRERCKASHAAILCNSIACYLCYMLLVQTGLFIRRNLKNRFENSVSSNPALSKIGHFHTIKVV
jgi:hypothetical protein